MDILVMTRYNIIKNIKFTIGLMLPALVLGLFTHSLLIGAFVYVFNLELSAACYFDKRREMNFTFWINGVVLFAVSSLAFLVGENKLLTLVTLLILTFLSFYIPNVSKHIRGASIRYGAVNFIIFSLKVTIYKHFATELILFGLLGIVLFYLLHYYLIPERNFLYTENFDKIKAKIMLTYDRYFNSVLELLTTKNLHRAKKFQAKMNRHIRLVLSQMTNLDINAKNSQKILKMFEIHYTLLKSIEMFHSALITVQLEKNLSEEVTTKILIYIHEYQEFYHMLPSENCSVVKVFKEVLEHTWESSNQRELQFSLEVLELNRPSLITLFTSQW